MDASQFQRPSDAHPSSTPGAPHDLGPSAPSAKNLLTSSNGRFDTTKLSNELNKVNDTLAPALIDITIGNTIGSALNQADQMDLNDNQVDQIAGEMEHSLYNRLKDLSTEQLRTIYSNAAIRTAFRTPLKKASTRGNAAHRTAVSIDQPRAKSGSLSNRIKISKRIMVKNLTRDVTDTSKFGLVAKLVHDLGEGQVKLEISDFGTATPSIKFDKFLDNAANIYVNNRPAATSSDGSVNSITWSNDVLKKSIQDQIRELVNMFEIREQADVLRAIKSKICEKINSIDDMDDGAEESRGEVNPDVTNFFRDLEQLVSSRSMDKPLSQDDTAKMAAAELLRRNSVVNDGTNHRVHSTSDHANATTVRHADDVDDDRKPHVDAPPVPTDVDSSQPLSAQQPPARLASTTRSDLVDNPGTPSRSMPKDDVYATWRPVHADDTVHAYSNSLHSVDTGSSSTSDHVFDVDDHLPSTDPLYAAADGLGFGTVDVTLDSTSASVPVDVASPKLSIEAKLAKASRAAKLATDIQTTAEKITAKTKNEQTILNLMKALTTYAGKINTLKAKVEAELKKASTADSHDAEPTSDPNEELTRALTFLSDDSVLTQLEKLNDMLAHINNAMAARQGTRIFKNPLSGPFIKFERAFQSVAFKNISGDDTDSEPVTDTVSGAANVEVDALIRNLDQTFSTLLETELKATVPTLKEHNRPTDPAKALERFVNGLSTIAELETAAEKFLQIRKLNDAKKAIGSIKETAEAITSGLSTQRSVSNLASRVQTIAASIDELEDDEKVKYSEALNELNQEMLSLQEALFTSPPSEDDEDDEDVEEPELSKNAASSIGSLMTDLDFNVSSVTGVTKDNAKNYDNLQKLSYTLSETFDKNDDEVDTDARNGQIHALARMIGEVVGAHKTSSASRTSDADSPVNAYAVDPNAATVVRPSTRDTSAPVDGSNAVPSQPTSVGERANLASTIEGLKTGAKALADKTKTTHANVSALATQLVAYAEKLETLRNEAIRGVTETADVEPEDDGAGKPRLSKEFSQNVLNIIETKAFRRQLSELPAFLMTWNEASSLDALDKKIGKTQIKLNDEESEQPMPLIEYIDDILATVDYFALQGTDSEYPIEDLNDDLEVMLKAARRISTDDTATDDKPAPNDSSKVHDSTHANSTSAARSSVKSPSSTNVDGPSPGRPKDRVKGVALYTGNVASVKSSISAIRGALPKSAGVDVTPITSFVEQLEALVQAMDAKYGGTASEDGEPGKLSKLGRLIMNENFQKNFKKVVNFASVIAQRLKDAKPQSDPKAGGSSDATLKKAIEKINNDLNIERVPVAPDDIQMIPLTAGLASLTESINGDGVDRHVIFHKMEMLSCSLGTSATEKLKSILIKLESLPTITKTDGDLSEDEVAANKLKESLTKLHKHLILAARSGALIKEGTLDAFEHIINDLLKQPDLHPSADEPEAGSDKNAIFVNNAKVFLAKTFPFLLNIDGTSANHAGQQFIDKLIASLNSSIKAYVGTPNKANNTAFKKQIALVQQNIVNLAGGADAVDGGKSKSSSTAGANAADDSTTSGTTNAASASDPKPLTDKEWRAHNKKIAADLAISILDLPSEDDSDKDDSDKGFLAESNAVDILFKVDRSKTKVTATSVANPSPLTPSIIAYRLLNAVTEHGDKGQKRSILDPGFYAEFSDREENLFTNILENMGKADKPTKAAIGEAIGMLSIAGFLPIQQANQLYKNITGATSNHPDLFKDKESRKARNSRLAKEKRKIQLVSREEGAAPENGKELVLLLCQTLGISRGLWTDIEKAKSSEKELNRRQNDIVKKVMDSLPLVSDIQNALIDSYLKSIKVETGASIKHSDSITSAGLETFASLQDNNQPFGDFMSIHAGVRRDMASLVVFKDIKISAGKGPKLSAADKSERDSNIMYGALEAFTFATENSRQIYQHNFLTPLTEDEYSRLQTYREVLMREAGTSEEAGQRARRFDLGLKVLKACGIINTKQKKTLKISSVDSGITITYKKPKNGFYEPRHPLSFPGGSDGTDGRVTINRNFIYGLIRYLELPYQAYTQMIKGNGHVAEKTSLLIPEKDGAFVKKALDEKMPKRNRLFAALKLMPPKIASEVVEFLAERQYIEPTFLDGETSAPKKKTLTSTGDSADATADATTTVNATASDSSKSGDTTDSTANAQPTDNSTSDGPPSNSTSDGPRSATNRASDAHGPTSDKSKDDPPKDGVTDTDDGPTAHASTSARDTTHAATASNNDKSRVDTASDNAGDTRPVDNSANSSAPPRPSTTTDATTESGTRVQDANSNANATSSSNDDRHMTLEEVLAGGDHSNNAPPVETVTGHASQPGRVVDGTTKSEPKKFQQTVDPKTQRHITLPVEAHIIESRKEIFESINRVSDEIKNKHAKKGTPLYNFAQAVSLIGKQALENLDSLSEDARQGVISSLASLKDLTKAMLWKLENYAKSSSPGSYLSYFSGYTEANSLNKILEGIAVTKTDGNSQALTEFINNIIASPATPFSADGLNNLVKALAASKIGLANAEQTLEINKSMLNDAAKKLVSFKANVPNIKPEPLKKDAEQLLENLEGIVQAFQDQTAANMPVDSSICKLMNVLAKKLDTLKDKPRELQAFLGKLRYLQLETTEGRHMNVMDVLAYIRFQQSDNVEQYKGLSNKSDVEKLRPILERSRDANSSLLRVADKLVHLEENLSEPVKPLRRKIRMGKSERPVIYDAQDQVIDSKDALFKGIQTVTTKLLTHTKKGTTLKKGTALAEFATSVQTIASQIQEKMEGKSFDVQQKALDILAQLKTIAESMLWKLDTYKKSRSLSSMASWVGGYTQEYTYNTLLDKLVQRRGRSDSESMLSVLYGLAKGLQSGNKDVNDELLNALHASIDAFLDADTSPIEHMIALNKTNLAETKTSIDKLKQAATSQKDKDLSQKALALLNGLESVWQTFSRANEKLPPVDEAAVKVLALMADKIDSLSKKPNEFKTFVMAIANQRGPSSVLSLLRLAAEHRDPKDKLYKDKLYMAADDIIFMAENPRQPLPGFEYYGQDEAASTARTAPSSSTDRPAPSTTSSPGSNTNPSEAQSTASTPQRKTTPAPKKIVKLVKSEGLNMISKEELPLVAKFVFPTFPEGIVADGPNADTQKLTIEQLGVNIIAAAHTGKTLGAGPFVFQPIANTISADANKPTKLESVLKRLSDIADGKDQAVKANVTKTMISQVLLLLAHYDYLSNDDAVALHRTYGDNEFEFSRPSDIPISAKFIFQQHGDKAHAGLAMTGKIAEAMKQTYGERFEHIHALPLTRPPEGASVDAVFKTKCFLTFLDYSPKRFGLFGQLATALDRNGEPILNSNGKPVTYRKINTTEVKRLMTLFKYFSKEDQQDILATLEHNQFFIEPKKKKAPRRAVSSRPGHGSAEPTASRKPEDATTSASDVPKRIDPSKLPAEAMGDIRGLITLEFDQDPSPITLKKGTYEIGGKNIELPWTIRKTKGVNGLPVYIALMNSNLQLEQKTILGQGQFGKVRLGYIFEGLGGVGLDELGATKEYENGGRFVAIKKMSDKTNKQKDLKESFRTPQDEYNQLVAASKKLNTTMKVVLEPIAMVIDHEGTENEKAYLVLELADQSFEDALNGKPVIPVGAPQGVATADDNAPEHVDASAKADAPAQADATADANGPIDKKHILEKFYDLGLVIQEMINKGSFHGDLHKGNVMMKNGKPVLVDIGGNEKPKQTDLTEEQQAEKLKTKQIEDVLEFASMIYEYFSNVYGDDFENLDEDIQSLCVPLDDKEDPQTAIANFLKLKIFTDSGITSS